MRKLGKALLLIVTALLLLGMSGFAGFKLGYKNGFKDGFVTGAKALFTALTGEPGDKLDIKLK